MFHFHCYIVQTSKFAKIFNSRCTLHTLLGQDRKMWFLWFCEIFRIIQLKFGDYCSEIAIRVILTRLHHALFATAEKILHEFVNKMASAKREAQRSEKVLLK